MGFTQHNVVCIKYHFSRPDTRGLNLNGPIRFGPAGRKL